MFTKEMIQKMKEDDLSQKVLIPLLRAMGFEDVYYHHGSINEQGKDIVCWKSDELNSRKNYALVVKVVPITGQARSAKGSAGEVATQIQQAFGDSYLDPVTSEPQNIHECWVITSQKLIPSGEKSIRSILTPSNYDRHVKFIDGEKLWGLIEKHLATQTPFGRLLEVQKMLDGIDPQFQPVVQFDGSEIKLSLREKYKGAMDEKPLNFNVAFDFPDTPDGQLAKDALNSHYTAGTPVTVSSKFIQSIDFPETIKKILGPDFKFDKLEFSSARRDFHFRAKVEITSDDGDSFVLSHQDFHVKQSGTEETTLANSEKDSIIDVQFVLNVKTKMAKVKFGWNLTEKSYSCTQLIQIFELQNCLSKPFSMRLVSEELGVLVFSQRSESMYTPLQKFFFDSLKVLVRLQTKIATPIMIPIRDLTDEEIKSIAELIQIVQTGKISGKWDVFDVKLANLLPGALNTLSSKPTSLRLSAEQFENIFDVQIPLGIANTVLSDAIIENLEEVQDIINAGGNQVDLRFRAKDGKAMVEVFYDEYFRKA